MSPWKYVKMTQATELALSVIVKVQEDFVSYKLISPNVLVLRVSKSFNLEDLFFIHLNNRKGLSFIFTFEVSSVVMNLIFWSIWLQQQSAPELIWHGGYVSWVYVLQYTWNVNLFLVSYLKDFLSVYDILPLLQSTVVFYFNLPYWGQGMAGYSLSDLQESRICSNYFVQNNLNLWLSGNTAKHSFLREFWRGKRAQPLHGEGGRWLAGNFSLNVLMIMLLRFNLIVFIVSLIIGESLELCFYYFKSNKNRWWIKYRTS